MMARLSNPWFVAAARSVNAAFFLTTAVYAILTSSPFAYEQFIQPNIIAWLSNFVFLYADFYWLALCVTLLTLAPRLRHGRARAASWSYLIVGAAAGVGVLLVRVLPSGHQPVRSLLVALVSLVPIVCLAALDHRSAPPRATRTPLTPARMLATCAITAAVVWAIYSAAVPFRLRASGGLAAGLEPLGVGAAVAGVSLLTLLTLVFLVRSVAGRLWPIVGIGALGFALQRVVLVPIAIAGPSSWVLALALAVAGCLLVSGVAKQFGAADPRVVPRVVLTGLPLAAYAAMAVLTPFDWGFMLQKLSALAVGVAAFAAVHAMLRRTSAGSLRPERLTVAGPVIVLVMYAAAGAAAARIPQADFILDVYSAGDPSFRLARQFLDSNQAAGSDGEFYAYLRAHSSLSGPISPVSIDFVPHMAPPAERPPNIFFFLIDSLRRDYLSAYNDAVDFTPRLDAFARESVVFRRAFSRYGGTGLAVPSIWAGSLLPHKQYVTPFAPMNALAKLLDAGGYRLVISRNHITEELFGFPKGSKQLDRDVPEMMQSFCGTIDQLTRDLHDRAGDQRPVFAYTRPLDLHIGNTRFAAVPAGRSYPGFFEPYAARVRRIDGCFGDFIDAITRAHLYEDSIVVVMADHGDSLGEGLRWGHGYTVVPEVLRIPLLIHLPPALRGRFASDPDAVSFGTDVTPSLYALLGYAPRRPRTVAGTSLFVPAGTPVPSRRGDAFTVASSYGAVYGLVRHNGRRLYIADAIEGRDYLYDLSPAGADARIGMTDAGRSADRALIREQIAEIDAWYGLHRR